MRIGKKTRREWKVYRAFVEMCKRIAAGCPESEFKQFACPECGGPLSIVFRRDGRCFVIGCALRHASGWWYARTPPEWWRNHPTGEFETSKLMEERTGPVQS